MNANKGLQVLVFRVDFYYPGPGGSWATHMRKVVSLAVSSPPLL